MNASNRRDFIHQTMRGAIAAGALATGMLSLTGAETKKRKMTLDLVCRNLGVSASQLEAIDLAARHRFESVGADGTYLAVLTQEQAADLKSRMKSKGWSLGPPVCRWTSARTTPGLKKA